jgi:hypothetical protein
MTEKSRAVNAQLPDGNNRMMRLLDSSHQGDVFRISCPLRGSPKHSFFWRCEPNKPLTHLGTAQRTGGTWVLAPYLRPSLHCSASPLDPRRPCQLAMAGGHFGKSQPANQRQPRGSLCDYKCFGFSGRTALPIPPVFYADWPVTSLRSFVPLVETLLPLDFQPFISAIALRCFLLRFPSAHAAGIAVVSCPPSLSLGGACPRSLQPRLSWS